MTIYSTVRGESPEGQWQKFSTIQAQNETNRKWRLTASSCSKGRGSQTEQGGKIYELTFEKSSEGVLNRNNTERYCTHKRHDIEYKQHIKPTHVLV